MNYAPCSWSPMWAQGHVGKTYMDPKETKQYRRADKTRFVSQYNKDMRPLEQRETCIPKKKDKRPPAVRKASKESKGD